MILSKPWKLALLLLPILGSGCALPVVNLCGTTNIVIVQKYNHDGEMVSTTTATEANPTTNSATIPLTEALK